MSAIVNTIKKLWGILIGVLGLTYFISLNMENHFIELNVTWISNYFLFTIEGGVFASLIVVLICELVRYHQLKLATENALLVYLGNLYGQFLIIRSNCKRSLNNAIIVPENLIQSNCDNATIIADSVFKIDYKLICKYNRVEELLNQFKANKYVDIKNVLISFIFLRIAINEDKKLLIQQRESELVKSTCPNTNKVLNKVVNQSTTILTYLDQVLTQMDDELGHKYQWQSKKQVLNTYQSNYIGQQLENFLNEDVIVF